MKMKVYIDPTQLQRLVDGECTSAEVRAILMTARSEPGCWEQIAVALLEDRAWQCRLQPQAMPAAPSSNLAALEQILSQAGSEDRAAKVAAIASATDSISSPRATVAATQRSFPLSWLAMAASLIVVALLGYSIGQYSSTPSDGSGLAVDSSRNAPAVPQLDDLQAPRTTLASLEPNYRMQLPAAEQREPGRLRPNGDVPMYEITSLKQWRELDQPQRLDLTPEQLAELNARGIGVQKDFDVLSGKFDDGRVFLVPIRSIRVSPWQ
jgi:hypothetical protein